MFLHYNSEGIIYITLISHMAYLLHYNKIHILCLIIYRKRMKKKKIHKLNIKYLKEENNYFRKIYTLMC